MTITAEKLYSSSFSYLSDKKAEELEREFFSMIRVNGRINKTTWSGRLTEVDESIENYLQETGIMPRKFLDVAVSSAISTLDWCRRLSLSGRPFVMTATDLTFTAYLVPIAPKLKILTDSQGTALQYDFLGFGIRPGRPRPRDWLIGIWVVSAFMGFVYRWRLRRLRLLKQQGVSNDFSSIIKMWVGVQHIRLVSPRILDNESINFIEDDLFQPVPTEMRSGFDVIRVANLLNHDYFNTNNIIAICRRLKQCMVNSSSLLVICRTRSDGSNHGTIFRLSIDGTLVPVKRIGEGSEIEKILVQA